MKFKMKIKIVIDCIMTTLLLLLMAYQITGQKLHEWIGSGMLVLFAIHNLLNFRWYRTLLKGRYTLLRTLQTIINFGTLLSILCLGYSGIVMSRHVFSAIPMSRPMATARTMHLAASYWGFVLMSVHMGLHWGMVLGMFRKLCLKAPAALTWIGRFLAVLIAGYGLYCFWKENIIYYMFLKSQFVFFDFEKNAASVFTEYAAMMGFWIFVSFYAGHNNALCAVCMWKKGYGTG